jgi:hypothetical protein
MNYSTVIHGSGGKSLQQSPNKALHPTASVPLVPHFTSAAGELIRSAVAHGFGADAVVKCQTTNEKL